MVVDPTKVKVGERERAEGEARLLETTVGQVVPLLHVAPARVESELDASVDKLFDESGGADQVDSATGGGQETEADIVMGVRFVDAENVAVEKPKRPRKKRQVAADASGPSHPLKKLRSGLQVVATLPFVTSSVSATPEHESGVPVDSITSLNLCTVGASARSAVVPPLMTEAVTTTHVATIPSVMALEYGTKTATPVYASMFHDFESTGTARPNVVGSSHPPVKELSIGSREIDSESLHEVFVLCWNIPNDSLLDNLDTSREFIDHVAPSVLFAQIRDMDYDELFTEFSVGTVRQACLSAEVRMRTEYCLSGRRRLESDSEKQAGLLNSRDEEIENLKTQLLLKEAEAAKVARLRTQVSAFEAAEQVHVDELNSLKQRNMALEDEKESLNGKVAELQSLVSVKDCELKDVDAIVTSLKSQNDGLADQEKVTVYENFMGQLERFQDDRMKVVNDKWLLTQGMELAVVKCLNSPKYLSMLEAAISKAIEKGMQDGLSAGITHGNEGRSLMDVAAYNPSVKADYVSALQALQSVNFSLLTELKANNDASVETLMDLLRLEEPLAKKLGLHELQPTFDQLMVPIHHSPDQTVIGVTALLLALDVSDIRVRKIRENIANQWSALYDVFVPLAEPFSSAALVGTEGTSSVVPVVAHTTTALSTTFASVSIVPPITIEDYEFTSVGGPKGTQ
ncbi:hypothetical protein Tco_1382501 [Tanacetum coccineum]